MTDEEVVGRDQYDRDWRVNPFSSVEHIVKPANSESGDWLRNLVRLSAGATLAYCGLDITGFEPSAMAGEYKPCGRCQHSELISDD